MKYLFIPIITTLLFIVSCKNETAVKQETATSGYIEITKEQFKQDNMSLGAPENVILDESINFTGTIVATINGIAEITAPVEGMVKSIKVSPGQLVEANEKLFRIGGYALIELQQEFSMSSAKIKQLKAEYERAKSLFQEGIKTENEFLVSESDYKSELANYNALKLRIQQIGLDITDIEKGNYTSEYCIYSPIKGQISSLKAFNGQYINREDEIAEIVNREMAELQLSFYEKDFPKIAIGQQVVFGSLNDNEYIAKAMISRLGAKINTNSNTLACYASINKEFTNMFAINQHVVGEVIVTSDSVKAIPQSSLITEANNKYVLVLANEANGTYQFEKQKVETGISDDENIEIIDFYDKRKILLKGVQDINVH